MKKKILDFVYFPVIFLLTSASQELIKLIVRVSILRDLEDEVQLTVTCIREPASVT